MERYDHIRTLFGKYLNNRLTEGELKELLDHFNLDEDKVILSELIEKELEKDAHAKGDEALIYKIDTSLQKKIFSRTKPVSRIKRLLPAISVAAMILLGLSFIGIMLITKKKDANEIHVSQNEPDARPGGSIATLTLADGSKINLSAVKNGNIATQPGVKIVKTANGQVIYTVAGKPLANNYNTIETPSGGEYQVQLPDGTKVWLNAASSLKYPIAFTGLKERVVELTGEAYFEVAHNKSQPFQVLNSRQTVEVLGTHFNIMAYKDEKEVRTTLLEGSVKVIRSKLEKIIKPGQQALVGEGIIIREADVEAAVAWKNGRTYFRDADIPTIMRSLSRWYNVQIVYEGKIPDALFTGGISRKSNLSGLIKILRASDINATIEGSKLIVKP
ncbi:DUF4974 domain-containing protein [Flavobacterium sp. Sd200]|uniref:FecR family protein n=1 Tax=Flavobacterium sp. Sd200 TaxID=2692211 RepID=UPI00136E4993|nr:FecR family protein [Flavobacterium sp. Sd200]MXN91146.1 DUF4974 domain-containing protein [Flavobacterium sp. Sd200]